MKILLSIAIFVVALPKIYAQEPADALRYSWITQSGTARNQAIGGAGGSLGGEFSTMFMNPAGIGFYKTSEFVITPGYNMQKSKSVYKETNASTKSNDFNLGATGFLFSIPNSNTSKVKNFTVGLGINKTADFNSKIYYQGINNNSSYSEKYLEELINNNVTDPNKAATDYPFGASLAFNTFLIDTTMAEDSSVSGYRSLADFRYGLNQQNTIESSGGITDIALAGAVNMSDKLFIGGSITVPVVNFKRKTSFTESDASANTTNNFNYFEVDETLQTTGFGVNGKIGLIYKPVEYIRLGLAFHTPTFYELTDKYTTEIITDLDGYGGAGTKKQNSGDFNNGAPGESKYNLTTPYRLIASASYVFREVENVQKQKGFITADVEYTDYTSANFKAINNEDADNYYPVLNKVIDDEYKGAFNFRLGGELKFNTLMFRLGGAYYSNPYKDEKANRIKIGGGLGYRNKGVFLDLTYVYSINKDVNYPYRLQDNVYYPAFVNNNAGNIIATVGFKL
jgi:hypothetical protein